MTVRELRSAPTEALTKRQLAERMGVGERTVDRWVAAGVPCERWGPRLRRFDPVKVRAWLANGGYQGEAA